MPRVDKRQLFFNKYQHAFPALLDFLSLLANMNRQFLTGSAINLVHLSLHCSSNDTSLEVFLRCWYNNDFLLRSPFGVAGVMPSSHFSLRQLSFGDISMAATNSIARRSGEGSFNGFSCKLYDFSSGKAALKTLSCSAVVIRRSEVTREIFNNNLDNNISRLGK